MLRDSWEVVNLTRSPREDAEGVRDVGWDGRTVGDWAAYLDGSAAVVNLTGRSVDCRYNARNRAEIMSSRIDSVRAIGAAIRKCAAAPGVWIQAGSLAIYGDAEDRICDETAPHDVGADAAYQIARRLRCVAFDSDNGAPSMATMEWLASHAYHVGVADARWFIPLLTTLDEIDIGAALYKPWPEAHCIWENLLHIQFWLKEGMLRMEGEREDTETDFPPPPAQPDEETWDTFRGSMRASLAKLLDQIRAIREDQIDTPCVDIEATRAELIVGLLTHLAYHLGQIRLLRGLYLHR